MIGTKNDPVVYGWCRNHGLSVLDPEAELEFSIWCAELDINADVNDENFVDGYDMEEANWLREVELENEILREEFYESYGEFLDGPYSVWQDEMYEFCY